MIDVSVLLLFHARADHFGKVWQEVKKAQPTRLFLYQDGPRMVNTQGQPIDRAEQSKDWPGIMECRNLVCDAAIDWPCEVHRLYQDKNYGCDPSEYLSQRWAFSLTDKCIVLEDDDVPSQSFFSFCKEMLDRYADDERVTLISGFNTDEETAQHDPQQAARGSYFFTRAFSIWGWASWARVVNQWDGDYGFVKDAATFDRLKAKAQQYRQRDEMITLCRQHAAQGKAFYETIFWAHMMLSDGMAIMPTVNLINNIGLDGGTHYSTQLELQPKRLRQQFTMQRFEITEPLTHPSVVKEYGGYQERLYLRNAWNNPWRKVQYSLEELWLNLRHGHFGHITASIKNRIRKTLHLQ